MQIFAPSFGSSESESRSHSRAATKIELRGKLHFGDKMVLERLQVNAVSDAFCASCLEDMRNDQTVRGGFDKLCSIVSGAETPSDHRIDLERSMCEHLVRHVFHVLGVENQKVH